METAETLFPVEDPLDRTVRVGENHYYRVVGVTERRTSAADIGGSLSTADFNRDAYIPFETDRVRFGKLLLSQRAGSWQAEKLEISRITVIVDNMEHGEA